jgi:predicted nucleic acid-binding Zn ribbon protein
MRGKPPTRLAEALGSWLDKAGLARRLDLAQAVDGWAETVGPQVAAVTRAEAVNAEGTLWVRVASSAWANELSLMAPRILAKLNQNRRGRIKEIRWLTGLGSPGPRQEE